MKLQTGNGLTLRWLKKVTLSAATMADKSRQCKYCGFGIYKRKPAVHMCEKKRRHLQKDEKRVQLGLYDLKIL